ncbi:DUF1648 domain-containing protein [Curtobacterium sp. L1-20]|uniref:DUF1648 domain-containing protein n=1 Tax=Curtobacterium sp. L1-20 TaxID=3138181 RepID=UPI003B52C73E
MSTGARVAVVTPGALVVVALAVAALSIGPGLPTRVATHFGADGTADGWGSPWPFFWVATAFAVLAAGLAVGALRARDRRTWATVLLVTNLLGGTLGTAWIAVAVVNTTTADPVFPMWWALVVLPVSVLVAAPSVVALVRAAGPVPARDVPPLDVGPDAHVAWRARIGSPWLALVGVASLAGGVWAAWTTASVSPGTAVVTGALLVVAGLAVLVLARVEVTVDRRGLRLTSTLTRIPVMRVPLARIESCGWEQVSPGQWGGWGYRISGRGVAYVVRSGPGLVARLRGGGTRMVTVPDAERGAAALGALLAARG